MKPGSAASPIIGSGTAAGIGIDLGGTKISAIAFTPEGRVAFHERVPTPRDDYDATLSAIAHLVESAAASLNHTDLHANLPVGIAMPGSIAPETGLVQNANSTWLNNKPFQKDAAERIGRPVKCANDANCFLHSEVHDGAAQGQNLVFGVILGTGCGGAIALNGEVINGHRAITGEWGHTPLALPSERERTVPPCWCGRRGCIETFVSGPALVKAARSAGLDQITRVEQLVDARRNGCPRAAKLFDRHADQLARALAGIVNILDPDCIVLGGGLSQLDHLYDELPGRIAPHIFAHDTAVDVRSPEHGDDSGVRGAARLWQQDDNGQER